VEWRAKGRGELDDEYKEDLQKMSARLVSSQRGATEVVPTVQDI